MSEDNEVSAIGSCNLRFTVEKGGIVLSFTDDATARGNWTSSGSPMKAIVSNKEQAAEHFLMAVLDWVRARVPTDIQAASLLKQQDAHIASLVKELMKSKAQSTEKP